ADRMAAELAARGLRRGDRLCVHLPNGIAFLDIFLACVRLGAVLVPINTLYRERELRHIIADAEPVATVVMPNADATYPAGATLWGVAELSAGAASRAASRPPSRPDVALDGDDPALIIYTSGTTGVAKGAVLTHNNLATNGITLATVWRFTEADRYLAMLPLFHVHGLGNGVHCWLT